jgi:hypothetical protein
MGELIGPQIQPRDLAAIAYDVGWEDARELVICLAVCLSESQGYQHAYNDNKDANGVVTSRDVGVMQINIAADAIGTGVEDRLYDLTTNFNAAYALYARRGFQPWVAYNTDVYLHDTYLERAVAGVANFLGEYLLEQPVKDWNGSPYVHRLTSPVVNYQHRLVSTVAHVDRARKTLGWTTAAKSKVDATQLELAKAQTAAKQQLPTLT